MWTARFLLWHATCTDLQYVKACVSICPLTGARSETRWVRLPRKENARSCHQRLFEENVGKTKMEKVEGLRILKMRVQEFFMHGEGISTPRVRHKVWQPLIKCAKSWLQICFIFPFYVFLSFWVDKSGALAPTYPQLWWGTQTYVVF